METLSQLPVNASVGCGPVFKGTLKPVSGDGDAQGPGNPDEPDSFLDFRGGQTLYAPSGAKLTFLGYYKLGYKLGTKKVDVVTGEPG